MSVKSQVKESRLIFLDREIRQRVDHRLNLILYIILNVIIKYRG